MAVSRVQAGLRDGDRASGGIFNGSFFGLTATPVIFNDWTDSLIRQEERSLVIDTFEEFDLSTVEL